MSMQTQNPSSRLSFTNLNMQMSGEGVLRGMDPTGAVVTGIRAMVESAIDAVRRWSYEAPAEAPISFNVTFGFSPDRPTTATQSAQAPVVQATEVRSQWALDGAVRIGGAVKQPTKIRDVRPVYPAEAQAARVMGVVIVEARIEPDGTVSKAHVLRSIPLLDQAAIDAVMQWRFVPTLLNGQAIPVVMTVTVNFTLQ